MDVIGKIRRLHARDKLTEREIARKTGLSRNTVSKWLRAPVNEAPIFSVTDYGLEAEIDRLDLEFFGVISAYSWHLLLGLRFEVQRCLENSWRFTSQQICASEDRSCEPSTSHCPVVES